MSLTKAAGSGTCTHQVRLRGRGSLQVLERPGPPGAPTLLLLHGVTMTPQLCWSPVLPALGRRFRVLAPALRGHGGGISLGGSRFDLADCADDMAALVDQLDLDQVVPVGYSLGGMVAQLLWRRHPQRVRALVLAATAGSLRDQPFATLAEPYLPLAVGSVRMMPMSHLMGCRVLGNSLLGVVEDPAERSWMGAQLNRTSLASGLSAMLAGCEFDSGEWLGQVDVPTAVVVTTHDQVVPPSRQRRLAETIPGSTVVPVAGGHGVCIADPAVFARGLLAASAAVTQGTGRPPAPVSSSGRAA